MGFTRYGPFTHILPHLITIPTSTYNAWHNIINRNGMKHQGLVPGEIGSWSRSSSPCHHERHSFPFL